MGGKDAQLRRVRAAYDLASIWRIRCASHRVALAWPLAAPTKCHASAGAATTMSTVALARFTRRSADASRKWRTARREGKAHGGERAGAQGGKARSVSEA